MRLPPRRMFETLLPEARFLPLFPEAISRQFASEQAHPYFLEPHWLRLRELKRRFTHPSVESGEVYFAEEIRNETGQAGAGGVCGLL